MANLCCNSYLYYSSPQILIDVNMVADPDPDIAFSRDESGFGPSPPGSETLD